MVVLIAWPPRESMALAQALRNACPGSRITAIRESTLAEYLSGPSIFDSLVLTWAGWLALTAPQRAFCTGHVGVLVLGPQPVEAAAIDGIRTTLSFRVDYHVDQVVEILAYVHGLLAEGTCLSDAVIRYHDALLWLGEDYTWQQPKLLDSGRALASVRPRSARPLHQQPPGTADVQIGQLIAEGDFVSGDKTIQHADGDQTIRGEVHAAKIVQQAGGDQANLNRMQGAPATLHQEAGDNQVNVNRVSAPQAPACPSCGALIGPTARFCQNCGTPIGTGRSTS